MGKCGAADVISQKLLQPVQLFCEGFFFFFGGWGWGVVFFLSFSVFHVLISRKDFQPMNFEECECSSEFHRAEYD